MYLMVIHLFKTEYKDDILLGLTSCGITRGNLIEGKNLDKELEHDVPIFTGLIKPQFRKERFALMLTAVIDTRKRFDQFINLLKEADIDIQKEDIMRAMLLPLDVVVDSSVYWTRDES